MSVSYLYKIKYSIDDNTYTNTLNQCNFGEFFFNNKNNNIKIIDVYKYEIINSNTNEYLLYSNNMTIKDVNINLNKYDTFSNNWDIYIAYTCYVNRCFYNYTDVETDEAEEEHE